MTNNERQRFRRVRGYILKILAEEHPRPVDKMVLHAVLDNMDYTISMEELESHICYLADPQKDYVRSETRARFNIVMVQITSKGLDLLDGFQPEKTDPGVNTEGL